MSRKDGMSEVDYVCSLDAASIKKAQSELGEIPEDRLTAVQALREWIDTQKHISFDKTDSLTLLKYLRWAKFSQLRAREIVEGNLRLKNIAPTWYMDVDTHDRDMRELIDSGFTVVLPQRTKDGCQVVLHRFNCLDPGKKNLAFLWCKFATVMVQYLTRSEETQVSGAVYIMDFTGVTAKVLLKLFTSETTKWNKLWQKNIPVRFKGFHFYNAGVLIDTIMGFLKPFLAKKFVERIHVHDTVESLYRHIPMEALPVEYLPDDYSGVSAGTLQKLTDCLKEEILCSEFRDELLYRTSRSFSIADKETLNVQTTQEYFRKLTVD